MGSAYRSPSHFSSPSPWISDISTATPATTATHLEEFPGSHEEEDHHENILQPSLPFCNYSLSAGRKFISLLVTDAVLKFFAVIFYGVLPCGFKNHTKKLRYSCFSFMITLLQWHNVFAMIYLTVTYWKSEHSKHGLIINTITLAGRALTYTLVMYYFYRDKNNFSNDGEQGWSIIPSIQFDLATEERDSSHTGPTKKDWCLANMVLLLGFSFITFLASISPLYSYDIWYGSNTIFEKLSKQVQLDYCYAYFIVLTDLFTSGAITLFCSIFYVITRDLIRHIEYTENAILVRARNRDDFYRYHQTLHQYTNKMVTSCKHWFAIHSLFVIALVFAEILHWFKFVKHGKMEVTEILHLSQYQVLVTEVTTLSGLIFTFAIPFISASLVTSKFEKFYFNLNMKCKIEGISELTLLSMNSGFKVYGFRINTRIAILTLISSFASLLKIWHL